MSLQTPEFWVVIPAAGCGSRMQQSTAKQYLELSGRKVIEYSLERFSHDRQGNKWYPLLSGCTNFLTFWTAATILIHIMKQ